VSPAEADSPRAAPRGTLAGWGGVSAPGCEVRSEDLAAVTRDAALTRGLGRAYGDAALPPPGVERVAGSRLADRILAFDPESGRLRAEAGLSLRALHRSMMPRGFFAPVSPGTEEVTLGGMVAADVHGKNHHVAGTFGRHVEELLLRVGDGRIVRCSPHEEADLFWATVGGMGLTGHVLEVTFRLDRIPSSWILCETLRLPSLVPLVQALREASARWPFTAAWIDCLAGGAALGRGVLHCGRWCGRDEAPPAPPRERFALPVPFHAPSWLLNRATTTLFNDFFYATGFPGRRVVHPAQFFYPLDRVQDWSRLYGRRGMTQHQCVLPLAGADEVAAFLATVRRAGGRPYLAVLKDFGAEGSGLLSFPRPGLTLALDFAVDAGTPALVAALNRHVRELGGRIYLAKDAFSTAADFAALEGDRLARFQQVRRKWDPEGRICSRLSTRLLGDAPAVAAQAGAAA
jgi:decaprenylphospho-beta-D-ribofuranose 2-oxidase